MEPAQPEPSPAVAQVSLTPSDSREPAMPPDFREPQPIPQFQFLASPQTEVSLETRIGGQWLNRIGIVAVLVGLSYFLKLAIENDWIGPGTRVVIGLVAGIGLILWSERFRARAFLAFAYSLKAIGIGALYLSLWAAFQFYHLVSAPVAFFAMILVTASSVAMSLTQNSELLAAFALVGGFLTPVLVSTNQNHEVALLSYVALLDLGTVWVVAIRGWQRLLLASFYWHDFALRGMGIQLLHRVTARHDVGLRHLLLSALRKSAIPGTQVRPGAAYPNVLVALALLNATCYFAATYSMLYQHYRFELAWLTVAVAALFFVLTRALQRREGSAHPLFGPLYLALGVGFLTIAIPIKLESYWNTLGWIVEAGALFWAAHRSGRRLLRILGTGAFLLGIFRLIMVDSFGQEPLLINPRFGLYLLAIAALALLAYFVTNEGGAGQSPMGRSGDHRYQCPGAAGPPLRGDGILSAATGGGVLVPGTAQHHDGARLRLFRGMDDLRQRLDAGRLLEALGLPALAGHRSAGDDGVEGVSRRHQHAGARLPHRCVHRPRRDSAGRVVLLSAQPDEKRRVEARLSFLELSLRAKPGICFC